MENEKLENLEDVELEDVLVPGDDMGDLINTLFLAGFSEEEMDIVLEVYNDIKSRPAGEIEVDEEIIKISNKFEVEGLEMSEDDLEVIREGILEKI